MKKITLLLTAAACAVFSAPAAEPKDEVTQAIQALAAKPSYSWKSLLELANSQFTPTPLSGKTEKGGYTFLSQEVNGAKTQAILKGTNGLVFMEDEWKTSEEVREAAAGGGGGFGGPGFMGRLMLGTRHPVDDATNYVAKVSSFKAGDAGMFMGDLTEAGAKELLSFRRRRPDAGGDGPPPPKNAKGSLKVWVKDGVLAKYQLNVQGTTINRDGEERDTARTTTVEISDVGSTKVEIPAEAKKKLAAGAK